MAVEFPQLQPSVLSLALCFKVLDLLQDAKGGECDVPVLAKAVRSHLQQHMLVYGDQDWKPKMHYALHIPEQIQRDNMLYDCFVVERSHQLPKLIATSIDHTKSLDKSVIGRALLVRLRDLETFDERSGLRGHRLQFPELGAAVGREKLEVAAQAMVSGSLLCRGDLLFVGKHCMSLTAVAQAEGDIEFGLLGHACDLVRSCSPSTGIWRMQIAPSFLWLDQLRVRRAHAWTQNSDGDILALMPDLGLLS